VRFGPFELDARAGELRKHGIKIKLREQPVRILGMLLEHPGEVVLREEIRTRLWPNNTIVEFDHGINAAIQKLRDALGDSASEPRYVETVARRGYRFSGQVEKAADDSQLEGTTLSHYRILEKLGEGGMGVVWRAHDPRLNRDVAIKVSAEKFSDRFEREARAIAALNHPNICTLYDVGPNFLVMELIEGESPKGPLPLEDALRIARQIADALDAAHEKGIVHRDLKPGNIKIKPDGTVKVLDFGLAKTIELASGDPEDSPTVTVAGMIMGTAAYMSPEQARGKIVDKRADIWAFGVVLYELLTGRRPFHGNDLQEILASVVKDQPDLSRVPVKVRPLVERCLEKDPKKRLRDIGDAWGVGQGHALPSQTIRYAKLAWIAAAIATAGLATLVFLHLRERPPAPAQQVRFQIQRGGGVSPDGRKLAYVAGGRLWVHFLESGEARDLTDASGGAMWSPDSRFVAYPSQGKLKKIEATGGRPQIVADLHPGHLWAGGDWSQNDLIVLADTNFGLFRVPASGGTPVQLTTMDAARQDNIHFGVSFLPDGRHFVYSRYSYDERKSAVYIGSVDAKPEEQSSTPLIASKWQAKYVPSLDRGIGYLLFMRAGTLVAQPFDHRRMELQGQPTPIAEHVGDINGGMGGPANYSVSSNVLVFRQSARSDPTLTWYDPKGKALGTTGEPGNYLSLALSPDGTKLAASRRSEEGANIWLLDLSEGGARTRFTFSSATDANPVWSPDGTRIVFSSNRNGPYDLYEKPVNGGKEEVVLLKFSEDKRATSWSRDGRFLLYTAMNPKTQQDIWVLSMEGGSRRPVPFLTTEFAEGVARFSPDGHWVAYSSNESGKFEVYVRPFSMNSAGTAVEAGGKWQISSSPEQSQAPRWRGDVREVYYVAGGGTLTAVDIAAGPEFRTGKPHTLGFVVPRIDAWDSAADGKRFLATASMKSEPEPYMVVLNWQAGLKK